MNILKPEPKSANSVFGVLRPLTAISSLNALRTQRLDPRLIVLDPNDITREISSTVTLPHTQGEPFAVCSYQPAVYTPSTHQLSKTHPAHR